MLNTTTLTSSRIKKLDNRLANQIAAGEVVERPASVVKELLENAIDAKSSRIEVEIERGGTRLIRVTDNGSGIVKEDLELALSRHATSKIKSTKDLSQISSLGFRGEALASIGSVSRLCLTSRTSDSDFAWQAIAEGRDMAVDVQPASATVGTRIEVRDLFYNTPARQKFLRAEKTEFNHIEEIFKRHALANFEIAFILKHNQKVVKRIPASHGGDDIKRVESICGKAFASQAIEFACEHESVQIKGWLGNINFHRSESDIQYVFVNGRPVKDKMLNHAIRQSYQGLLPPGRMPTYVIFVEIDNEKIDVNVHPTKHEVRFDEQRLIHDLLVKSVADGLASKQTVCHLTSDKGFASEPVSNDFKEHLENNFQPRNYSRGSSADNRFRGINANTVAYLNRQGVSEPANKAEETAGEKLKKTNGEYEKQAQQEKSSWLRFENDYLLSIQTKKAYVIKEALLFDCFIKKQLAEKKSDSDFMVANKPLLFPQNIEMSFTHLEDANTLLAINTLGFIFEPVSNDCILLRGLPNWLQSTEIAIINTLFPKWVSAIYKATKHDGFNDLNERKNIWSEFHCSLKPFSDEMIDFMLASLSVEIESIGREITSEMIQQFHQ